MANCKTLMTIFLNASTLRISQHMCSRLMIQMSLFLSRSFAAHIGKPLVRFSFVNKKGEKEEILSLTTARQVQAIKVLSAQAFQFGLAFLVDCSQEAMTSLSSTSPTRTHALLHYKSKCAATERSIF